MRRPTTAAIIAASVSIILCIILAALRPSYAEHAPAPMKEEEFDVLVLSQGTSTDGFINREMEAEILAALKAIRAMFPEPANIYAIPNLRFSRKVAREEERQT